MKKHTVRVYPSKEKLDRKDQLAWKIAEIASDNAPIKADVVDMEKIINEFALLRNQWLGIVKALDIKQWQLSNIIKLRTAGLEDVVL